MGFAAGALGATQRYFETQRAQEAERLKEERLAAIRASERAEDRAFQRETFELQSEREMSREERMQQRQIEAESRAESRAIEGETRAEARQRRLLAEQAKYRAPDNPGYVEGEEILDGKRIPFAMRRDEFNALPAERRQNMRFRGYYGDEGGRSPAATPAAPAAPTPGARRPQVDVVPANTPKPTGYDGPMARDAKPIESFDPMSFGLPPPPAGRTG